jgi:hypothetical protein
MGEISEFDAEGERTGSQYPLVIGVPGLIRWVGKGLDGFDNARIKTRTEQILSLQSGILQRVVQPGGLKRNILILGGKPLKPVKSRCEFHHAPDMLNVRISNLIGLSRMHGMRDSLCTI